MSTSRYAVLAALVIAAIAGIFATRSARAADDSVPAVGQQAPEFSLPSQEGTKISLDQYRGKWVVLYFYPKDMTSGCTMEAAGQCSGPGRERRFGLEPQDLLRERRFEFQTAVR